jgi:hypothetical protein
MANDSLQGDGAELMKRICAWCGADLDDSGRIHLPDEPITHGICSACKSSVLKGNKQSSRDFLERLGAPVLLVTGDVVVETANVDARAMIGKKIEEIEGFLGGVVMECAHARQPGGCGKTKQCLGCQIRASVNHTYRTGEALLRVEAYLDVWRPRGVQRWRVCISTERVDEKVLMRLDVIETVPEG